MASGFTNRGKKRLLAGFFQNANQPASFEIHLATSNITPTADTNVLTDVTEVANGNGYTASTGFALARNAVDFDTLTEDDTGDEGVLRVKDVQWVATGGPIPASGGAPRWALLTTPDVGAGNKDVLAYFDLQADRPVSIGQPLTLQDLEAALTE